MRFLNARRLAEELRQDTLSEAQKYQFALASAVLNAYAGLGSYSTRLTYGYLLGVVVTVVISLVGLRACFKANERGDNQKFLERYFCLSVPLGIWMYALYASLFYVMYIAARQSGSQLIIRLFSGATPLTLLITSTSLIAYFVLLRRFIAIASSLEEKASV